MVNYSNYGLEKISSVSSSTPAASFDLPVNDTIIRYTHVIVLGTLHCETDDAGYYQFELRSGSDGQTCYHVTMNSGTNSNHNLGSSRVRLNYYNQGNTNNTSILGEMCDFMIEFNFDKSSSLPYQRFHTNYISANNTSVAHLSMGHGDYRETDSATYLRFYNSGSNITINAASYGLGARFAA